MSKNRKKIIIFGASGFIGGYLYKKFLEDKNTKVEGFSSKECNLLSLEELRSKIRLFSGDDTLIFASAINRLRENTFDSMIKNMRMAENVAALIREHPPGHCIFLSSIEVYSIKLNENELINEALKMEPDNYYGISKAGSEFLLKRECSRAGVPLAILRLSGIYGPGDNAKSTIGILIRSIFEKRKIYIYGDGKDVRDYVYVEDVYKIIDSALKERTDGILNIATGEGYSILQVVDIMHRLSPHSFEVEYRPSPDANKRRPRSTVFDCSLLEKEFPDLKMTSLEDGVSKYIDYAYGAANV